MRLVMFSKHLQELSIVEAAKAAAAIGFAGLDLTVRPAGHITPENARAQLPQAKRALADLGLDLPMVTTGITEVDSPHARDILETARALGIPNLKLGYWTYRPFGTFREQLDDAQRKLDGLERLAREIGVRVCIHTHSGNYLSAEETVVWLMLRDRDPAAVGAYIDPGHMTLEGGSGGWRQGIDLVQDYLVMMAVKSFGWFREEDPETGEARWSTRLVPLKQGIVKWREVLSCLKQLDFDGTVSFHSEYQGRSSWRDLNLEQLLAQTAEDLHYMQPLFREAGLA